MNEVTKEEMAELIDRQYEVMIGLIKHHVEFAEFVSSKVNVMRDELNKRIIASTTLLDRLKAEAKNWPDHDDDDEGGSVQ